MFSSPPPPILILTFFTVRNPQKNWNVQYCAGINICRFIFLHKKIKAVTLDKRNRYQCVSLSLLKLCFQEVKSSFFPSFDLEICKKMFLRISIVRLKLRTTRQQTFNSLIPACVELYTCTRVHGRKEISRLLSQRKGLHKYNKVTQHTH